MPSMHLVFFIAYIFCTSEIIDKKRNKPEDYPKSVVLLFNIRLIVKFSEAQLIHTRH